MDGGGADVGEPSAVPAGGEGDRTRVVMPKRKEVDGFNTRVWAMFLKYQFSFLLPQPQLCQF